MPGSSAAPVANPGNGSTKLADRDSGSTSPLTSQLAPGSRRRMDTLTVALLESGFRNPEIASPRISVPVSSSGLIPVRE